MQKGETELPDNFVVIQEYNKQVKPAISSSCSSLSSYKSVNEATNKIRAL